MKHLRKYQKTFDELKENNATQYSSYITGSQYINAYKLVKKYIPNNSKVLDWGSGSGHFSYFLLKEGYEVSGYNFETECHLFDLIEKKYPGKYNVLSANGEVTELPFNDNSFDAVLSIGVLEHVRETGGNEIGSLKEIKRILKPKGIFICYHLPNKFSWIEALSRHIKNKHHHISLYTNKDIARLNEKAGMKLLENGRYGIIPRNTFNNFPNNLYYTNLFNKSDAIIGKILKSFTQNYYFVSKKTDNLN